jgi:ArsR family transcriptional regulator
MIPTVLESPAALTIAAKPVRLTRARRTAILKALADPRRFELLERIAKADCPLGCTQALATLPISAATLSHHIKELETAGLVHVRREGKFHFLTLRPGVLLAVASVLSALEISPCGPRLSRS